MNFRSNTSLNTVNRGFAKVIGGHMGFHGSITFDIADEKNIDVNFGVNIIPTKTVKKSDIVALGRKESYIKKIAILDCEVEIEIISFGMVEDK